MEKRRQDYHALLQRALFDTIGARGFVLKTDAYGNFLTQGYELASARDWARLANGYLQDGSWNGERLLPEGYVKFANGPALAWVADQRLTYGAFFWINSDGAYPLARETCYKAGSGAQLVFMISSHQSVIVRLGYYKGGAHGNAALRKAMALLMKAVPAVNKQGKWPRNRARGRLPSRPRAATRPLAPHR